MIIAFSNIADLFRLSITWRWETLQSSKPLVLPQTGLFRRPHIPPRAQLSRHRTPHSSSPRASFSSSLATAGTLDRAGSDKSHRWSDVIVPPRTRYLLRHRHVHRVPDYPFDRMYWSRPHLDLLSNARPRSRSRIPRRGRTSINGIESASSHRFWCVLFEIWLRILRWMAVQSPSFRYVGHRSNKNFGHSVPLLLAHFAFHFHRNQFQPRRTPRRTHVRSTQDPRLIELEQDTDRSRRWWYHSHPPVFHSRSEVRPLSFCFPKADFSRSKNSPCRLDRPLRANCIGPNRMDLGRRAYVSSLNWFVRTEWARGAAVYGEPRGGRMWPRLDHNGWNYESLGKYRGPKLEVLDLRELYLKLI